MTPPGAHMSEAPTVAVFCMSISSWLPKPPRPHTPLIILSEERSFVPWCWSWRRPWRLPPIAERSAVFCRLCSLSDLGADRESRRAAESRRLAQALGLLVRLPLLKLPPLLSLRALPDALFFFLAACGREAAHTRERGPCVTTARGTPAAEACATVARPRRGGRRRRYIRYIRYIGEGGDAARRWREWSRRSGHVTAAMARCDLQQVLRGAPLGVPPRRPVAHVFRRVVGDVEPPWREHVAVARRADTLEDRRRDGANIVLEQLAHVGGVGGAAGVRGSARASG